jgi:hypothetical protein
MKQGGIVFKKIFCFSVMLFALWATPVLAEKRLVPSQYPTIQEAIDAAVPGDAESPGDVVVVADGIYSGQGNVNLLVDKAITITSQNGREKTTIDCGGNGRAFTFSGPGASGAVLIGFTITGGNGQGYGDWPGFGGAILFQDHASVTISDCTISGNTENILAGVISCIQSSPVIKRCIIENNIASYGGGLVCALSSSPTLVGCTITNNKADMGGGVYLDTDSSPAFISCLIAGNSAGQGGGAFFVTNNCFPNFAFCTVTGNSVSDSGAYGGGGIFSYYECSTSITDSILWGNEATNGAEVYLYSSSIAIDHSDVRGGAQDSNSNIYIDPSAPSEVPPGEGNIDQDPLFVGAGDYHLSPGSPCIDAGNGTVALPSIPQDGNLLDYDIEGDPRVVGKAPDMGADEFVPEEEQAIQVEIDIKPGCWDKKINLKSWGLLPVAVKTTSDFDARSIDPSTVEFAGAKPVWKMRVDVDRDRHKDMLFFFWIKKLNLDENSTEATLTGKTKDGKSFKGTDKVTILKPKTKAKDKAKGRCSGKR